MGSNLEKKQIGFEEVKYSSYGVKIFVMRLKKRSEIKIMIFSTP